MKRTFSTALLAALLLLAAQAQPPTGTPADTLAADSLPPMPWEQKVRCLLDSLTANSEILNTSQLGLMVWDLTADSALYAYNHHQRMRPASTMKLLTAITAIDQLGGNHPFTTTLTTNGTITQRTDSTGGTLHGDLICSGGMDPAFSSADMKVLADRIRQAGIDTIRGRIVADKSFKDTLLLGQGWCWDDNNPCLSPLLVDRKDRFAEQLRRELTTAGIAIEAPATDRQQPYNAATWSGTKITHTLDHILQRMMKQSDNLYAECVFYHTALAGTTTTGKNSRKTTATAKNARTAVKREIQLAGLDPATYSVADGSGLSLYNYVSPELLTLMLRYAWQNDNIRQYLMPSLPVAGADGTLKERMRKTAAEHNVRAKTGTLTGISSLAGYCTAPNGHQLAFAIINQGILKAASGKAFQDKVCTLLCTPESTDATE